MRVYDLVALGRFPHTNWIGNIDRNTDLIIRGFPGFDIGNYGKLTLYGAALRHNFGSYIKLPFDIALQGGFQNLFVRNNGSEFVTANSYFPLS
jgi:hypothetical protein